MTDTNRARTTLQALLADNFAGDISAQDLRDLLASVPLLNVPGEQTGASYTFALEDADRTVILNRATAQPITIPTNAAVAFPIGTRIRCLRKGAGLPTIAGDVGVTLNKPTGIKPNVPSGALVKKASDHTAQDLTSVTALTWDTEVYDHGGWHESVTNPSRLTVPTGVTKVRLSGQVHLTSVTGDMWGLLTIHKNDALFDGYPRQVIESGATIPGNNIAGPVIEVTAGDYFELRVQVETDASVNVEADGSWFAIEAVAIDPVGTIAYQHGFVTIEKIGADEWSIEGPALG